MCIHIYIYIDICGCVYHIVPVYEAKNKRSGSSHVGGAENTRPKKKTNGPHLTKVIAHFDHVLGDLEPAIGLNICGVLGLRASGGGGGGGGERGGSQAKPIIWSTELCRLIVAGLPPKVSLICFHSALSRRLLQGPECDDLPGYWSILNTLYCSDFQKHMYIYIFLVDIITCRFYSAIGVEAADPRA